MNRGFMTALAVLAAWLLCACAARAANRTYLAEQYDWSGSRGFFLSLENDAPDGTIAKLNDTLLAFGAGDGRNWRIVIHRPGQWTLGHEYTIEATITPHKAELRLDGQLLGTRPGAFTPAPGPALANHRPPWYSSPGDYIIAQTAFSIETDGRRLDLPFAGEGNRPLPVMLFSPSLSRSGAWTIAPGETHIIRAGFRFVPTADPRSFDPYIDAYGQLRYSDWPGLVKTDADLTASRLDEAARHAAWGLPTGYDAYGGSKDAPWKETATGFFWVVKRDGFWWLISPEGNPCFYTGICVAPGLTWEMGPVTGRENLFAELPPRSGATAGLWASNVWGDSQPTDYVALHGVSKIRKYGPDWRNLATASTLERTRTWGFSGLGKWSSGIGVPYFMVLSRDGVPNLVRHPDVFDAGIRAQFRQVLQTQVAPWKQNPMVVGWTLSSEYDEIVTSDETREMLRKGSDAAAKRAMVDHALGSLYGGRFSAMAAAWGVSATTMNEMYNAAPAPPAQDIETLRGFFAAAYYRFIYTTAKQLAPNHLYFGNWIVPGWWENEEDWRLIAPYCDVIGYDNYADDFTDPRLARLIRETDKPIFCGEFSFPPYYAGRRGFSRLWTWAEDDAHAGELYARWLDDATRNPYCVGVNWFCYRDQPITGRGPGRGAAFVYGENYAFGIIDETDRPKWDLVERMRDANLGAATRRFEAAEAHVPFDLARRALRVYAGLDPLTPRDWADLDTDASGPSAERIDMADALALARRGL